MMFGCSDVSHVVLYSDVYLKSSQIIAFTSPAPLFVHSTIALTSRHEQLPFIPPGVHT